MKIAHINDISNVGSTLVHGFQELGHDAELIRLGLIAGRYSTFLKLLALPLRLQEIAKINRQVKQKGYDFIHIHYAYLGWMGIFGRYPYFLHCHGTDVRWDLNHPLRKLWVKPSLQKARRVLVSTPDLVRIVRPFRPDAQFLPNPILTNRFTPGPAASGNHPTVRVLLYSELNDKIKGTSIAMEAISEARRRYKKLEVSAIARGPDSQKYLELAPDIEYLKPVPYTEVPALLRRFDIVIGQFVLGILSMAELESMASGKPVVCFFNFPEWYSEPPPVFSADEPLRASEMLFQLIENPTLRLEVGQSAREWVIKQHDYLQICRRLLEIYQS